MQVMTDDPNSARYSLTDVMDALNDPRIIAHISQLMDVNRDNHFSKDEIIEAMRRVVRDADTDTLVNKQPVPLSKEISEALALARQAPPIEHCEKQRHAASTPQERQDIEQKLLENPRFALQLKFATGLAVFQNMAQGAQTIAHEPSAANDIAEELSDEDDVSSKAAIEQAFSAIKAYDYQHMEVPSLEEIFPNLELPAAMTDGSKAR